MPVGEEAAARTFYSGVLGFTEIPKPVSLANRGGAWFISGTAKIHLGVETNFQPARKAHPALLVQDLEVILADLKRLGIDYDTTQPALDGYKRIHISDPFGNRIELMQKV